MQRKIKENKRPDAILNRIKIRNKVSALLTSDWHLREDQPTCRTDDFRMAQWKKLEFISDLQRYYQVPVLHGGDLFHHWKPSPWLLTETMGFLPNNFMTVYGQHDLPQHNMELAYKSGINTLETAGKLGCLEEANWNQEPDEGSLFFPSSNRRILVWHKFAWDGKKVPWPGCNEMTAEEILDKYPQFDLIVTGDHHKGFIFEKEGRLLVNPGCLTRQDASYANYQPRVYLYYAEDNSVERINIPIEKDVVNRDHIDYKEKHDQRINAFVERLNDDWDSSVSFEENLKRFFSNNKIRQSVKDIIYQAIES